MQQSSQPVVSSQAGIHPQLTARVLRHLDHRWQRPVADHSRRAFAVAGQRAAAHSGGLILDAGCGTGASSLCLARRCGDALVIGVDKSQARLGRGLDGPRPDNLLLLRADLVDFWRLAAEAGWQLARHCIFYPNPWPKPGHLGRRWHAHPVLPSLLALGGELELRTNWETYAMEWEVALMLHGWSVRREIVTADAAAVVSPFERKYLASGHHCWRLLAADPER